MPEIALAALDLTVLMVVNSRNDRDSKRQVLERYGVSEENLVIVQSDADPVRTLSRELNSVVSDHVLLLDTGQIPSAELVKSQLSCLSERQLDACLPIYDPIVYEPPPPASLIVGTIFRRSILQKALNSTGGSEAEFWINFARHGKIGTLPPNRTIARPGPIEVSKICFSTSDLVAAFVDPDWYYGAYPDVAKARADAAKHYLRYGWRERRDPNSWFNTSLYIDQHPESIANNVAPLEHFIRSGGEIEEGLRPGFDLRWIIHRHFVAKPRTLEALLGFFLPGVRKIAEKNRCESKEIWDQVEKAVPSLVATVRTLHALELSDYEVLVNLIDKEWYAETNPDAGADPIEHYLDRGWREKRDPNPWFNTHWYLEQDPEAAQMRRSALEHFVKHGAKGGRKPHPAFNFTWYARKYLPGSPLRADILLHFMTRGLDEGAVPDPRLDRDDIHELLSKLTPKQRKVKVRALQAQLAGDYDALVRLVDRDWYLRKYPDVDPNLEVPVHYLNSGWRERRHPNPWFDTAWYLAQDPVLAEGNFCPLLHYIQIGAVEGRRPCPDFDTVWYARQYLGGHSPSADALSHFLNVGLKTGAVPDPTLHQPHILKKVLACPATQRPNMLRWLKRAAEAEEGTITALVDRRWYSATYGVAPDDAATDYREKGWREGRNPNAWFDTDWYLQQNSDAREGHRSPLEHFVRSGALQGRNPHPFFDITWYTSKFLQGVPRAAALLHFIDMGLDAGAVPDPRLATEAVQKRLLTLPVAGRNEFLQRLIATLSRAAEQPQLYGEDDADLWPVLLTRNFAVNTLAVLLLFRPEQADQARAAAMALSVEESAIFAFVESDSDLRLTDRTDSEGISVILKLPKQMEGLRGLLGALPTRRAAAIGTALNDTPVVRMVRTAGVPVYTNTSGI